MTRDFLADNLKTIAEKRPELFHALKIFFAAGGASSFRIREIAGESPSVELADDRGNWSDWYGGSPSGAARDSLVISKPEYPRILVVDGFGLGYHVPDFRQNLPASVRDVLIIEKRPELFTAALKLNDWREYLMDEKYEFLVGLSPEDFPSFVRRYLLLRERIIYTEHVEHYYLKPALDHDGAYYQEFAKALRDGVGELREMYTAPGEDNYRALLNIVRNQERIVAAPMLDDFAGLFAGRPGLLISAGPALNDQLDDIRRYGERFVMVAVDAALKPLLAHGIRPHCVVIAERVINVRHFFEGIEPYPDIPLVTFPSLHPAVWPLLPGPVILMKRSATFGAWLYPDLPEEDTGLGVATVAYHVLAKLGCRSIAIVGQNLSFDAASASTHAEGVSEFMSTATMELPDSFTAGNDGNPVRTTSVWEYYRAEMERLIFAGKQPGRMAGSISRPLAANGDGQLPDTIATFNVIPRDKGAMIKGALRMDPAEFWRKAADSNQGDDGKIFREKYAGIATARVRVDFPELFAKSLSYLIEVGQQSYAAMEWISLDYHDRVDLLAGRELWDKHREIVEVWEERRRRIVAIDVFLFYRFLNCLTGKSHITCLSTRESAVPKPEAIRQYVFTYMLRTLEWFHEMGAWSARVIHLLEGAEAAQNANRLSP